MTARRKVGTAVCAIAILLLAGCTSVRSNLGTSDSPCYLALPAATRSVGATSRLVGVHLTTVRTIAKDSSFLAKTLGIGNGSAKRACVFEFAGRFSKSSVSRAGGHASGRFAWWY